MIKTAIIFGGTGFIGAYFSHYLIENYSFDKIYLLDIESPDKKKSAYRRVQLSNSKLEYIECDVRFPINIRDLGSVELIANFAAIHREPGHDSHEYFETNINGAENVCKFAEHINCNQIIFTSSIAPYGISDELRTEESLPIPNTPYGISKFVAEKIHQIWLAKRKDRNLIIVRPGVVFGAGEGGNVTRLIRAVSSGIFFFMGNRGTIKAGIYIKELCRSIAWAIERQKCNNSNFILFNATMNPSPSLEQYVLAIKEINKIKKYTFSIPYKGMLVLAKIIDLSASILRINQSINPVRIKKLVKSNNIYPKYIVEEGYEYLYTLKSAMVDWQKDCPNEWR
jgi:GlcNAc-P-P-Und epimerase